MKLDLPKIDPPKLDLPKPIEISIAPAPRLAVELLIAPAPRLARFKSDRPAKEVFPGYYKRSTEQFTIYVSRLAYEESDAANGEPLNVVDEELARIAEIFPESALKALRTVPIWVEWDHTIPESVRAFAAYYGPTGHALLMKGVDPRKSGCICVLSLKVAHKLKAVKNARQNVLLHEFAHAIHNKLFGRSNPFIENSYSQAMARELYNEVMHDDGSKGEAYAATNKAEYFAELTCAYLDRLDYMPHNAKELKELDSVGYELMTKAYGTLEEIAKAKKSAKDNKKNDSIGPTIITPRSK